jgi:HAMP domain-containing protein
VLFRSAPEHNTPLPDFALAFGAKRRALTPVNPALDFSPEGEDDEYDFTAEDAIPVVRPPVVSPIDADPSDYLEDDDELFPGPATVAPRPLPGVPRAVATGRGAFPVRSKAVNEAAAGMAPAASPPAARAVEVVAPHRPPARIPSVEERVKRHRAQAQPGRSPLGRLYDRVSTRVVLPSVFTWLISMVGFWFWWGAAQPDLVLTFTLISAWAVLVGGLVGTLALRPLAREVRRLHDATKSLADGEVNTPITSERDDELGDLAGALERARLRMQRVVAEVEIKAVQEA